MSRRQMYLGIAGLLLGVVGLFALFFPIYLDEYDSYGVKITCGNGISSDLTQAHQAPGGAVVSSCDSALLMRRAWAIPTVALGWVMVTGFLVVWVHNGQQRDAAYPG
ncbi:MULTISPECIES: hypothetical protein [Mycobacterium]|uniref:Transmembrane protein n=2 Tax=Mycobacterium TaxID=1763 RepID=A0A1W9ZJD2_MYCAN|nr:MULTISPECIES: hypothetical protein [Mycobacterium]MCV7076137.1 hypothetical protein [Mycobacterium szulgai]MCV7198261.1 hypothetical protein [Mycobacterium angelicum]ORA16634.1 hypothetical protein BST12_20355 [Mycobacterium angelicum]ORW92348.1 hypothetical protein AWC27_08815 [Mycobacterium szulgai]